MAKRTDNIVLPIEKLMGLSKKGVSYDKIYCTLKRPELFLKNLVFLSYRKLAQEGKIDVKKVACDKKLYQRAMQLYAARTWRDNRQASKEIHSRLMVERGEPLPSQETIRQWFSRGVQAKELPGVVFVESYLKEHLGIRGNLTACIKGTIKVRLLFLTFLACEILNRKPHAIGKQIAGMYVYHSKYGTAILKTLLESDLPMKPADIAKKIEVRYLKNPCHGLWQGGFFSRSQDYTPYRGYYVVKGEEHKFKALAEYIKG